MNAARLFVALLLAAPSAVSAPRISPDEEVVTVSRFLGWGGKAAPVG